MEDRRESLREIGRKAGVSGQFLAKHCARNGIKPGDDGLYDSTEVMASVEEGRKMDKAKPPKSKADLAIRKLEAETRLLEAKALILEKSVYFKAAVDEAWGRVAAAIRSEVMSIPAKGGQRCEMQPAAKVVVTLTEICNDALRLIKSPPSVKSE